MKVIAMGGAGGESGAITELLTHGGVDDQNSRIKRGAPRSASEWTALVKIASGELEVPSAHCERLVELGLVQYASGVPVLTQHGRLTLGLPE